MNLCYEIGSRLYRRRMKGKSSRSNDEAQSSEEGYWDWQYKTSPEYFNKFSDLQACLPGARVLDIGCGLGGRTCYLATKGVRSVLGIDINADEIAQAKVLTKRANDSVVQSHVSFLAVRENEPLDVEPFDIVTLVDSLEHVHDPVAMLNFAYSMTRPGGVCYFGTIGWYHYNAAHMMGILPIPFLTLLFNDTTILDAVRRITMMPDYRPFMWDSNPPVTRWAHVKDLRDRPGEYLNKITVQGLKRAMKSSRFGDGRLLVAGFSWRQCPWMRWLNVMAKIPVIQEVYHAGCFGRVTRENYLSR